MSDPKKRESKARRSENRECAQSNDRTPRVPRANCPSPTPCEFHVNLSITTPVHHVPPHLVAQRTNRTLSKPTERNGSLSIEHVRNLGGQVTCDIAIIIIADAGGSEGARHMREAGPVGGEFRGVDLTAGEGEAVCGRVEHGEAAGVVAVEESLADHDVDEGAEVAGELLLGGVSACEMVCGDVFVLPLGEQPRRRPWPRPKQRWRGGRSAF